MFLVVGLGNIGEKYYNTRHNFGFLVIDKIKENLFRDISWTKTKKSEYIKSEINGKKTFLLKPQVYMNRSGESVLELMSYFRIKKENIIVIVDDYDLPFGTMRIKTKGGSGHHNGLKSIEANIGKNYIRIRCGIFSDSNQPIDQFVLSPFLEKEKTELEFYTEEIAKSIVLIINENAEMAMNLYNNKNLNKAP